MIRRVDTPDDDDAGLLRGSLAHRRQVPEWIGKTPDSVPPPHVRLRIFETHHGVCHWSKRKIRPGDAWDVDHVIAIINKGENRESNMAPILRGKPHKEKTAQDVAEKSRVYRKRSAHLGLKKPRTITRWRRFDGTIREASRER